MMRFVQSYARAHAHAYPHTPTRIHMRTHTCSSFKQTEHTRGGIVPANSVLFDKTNMYFLRTRAYSHMPVRARTLVARESILGGGHPCSLGAGYPCSRGPRGCETSLDVHHS